MYRKLCKLGSLKPCIQQTFSYSAAPLAGRTYLAGSEAKTFPKFLTRANHEFPYVFKARNVQNADIEQFAENFRPILDSLIKAHGIVLIRGAEIYTEDDFSKFIHALNYKLQRYIPGLGEVRKKVAQNVYSARNDPPELNVEPHQEHSYLNSYPHLFMVHCEDPVDQYCGGDYIVVQTKDVQRQLDSEVMKKFDELGVRYHKRLPYSSTEHQPSWHEVMNAMGHDVIERRLEQHGFKFEWDEAGTLHYWIDRPAFANHFRTSEKLWFNQITTQHWTFHANHPRYSQQTLQPKQFPSNTYYGDGSEIDIDVIQHIRDVTWENAHGFKLKRGDVIIMDNMLAMHGRLAWLGQRKISVAHGNYH